MGFRQKWKEEKGWEKIEKVKELIDKEVELRQKRVINYFNKVNPTFKNHKKKFRKSYTSLNSMIIAKEYDFVANSSRKIIGMKIGIESLVTNKKTQWKNRIVELRDSLQLFPNVSIKKIGEGLNNQFKTKKYSKSEIEYVKGNDFEGFQTFQQFFKYKDGKELSYLYQDCFILLSFLIEMNKIVFCSKWKLTIASTAYSIWEEIYGERLCKGALQNDEIKEVKVNDAFVYYKFKGGKKLYKTVQMGKMLIKQMYPTKWLGKQIGVGNTYFDSLYKWYKGGICLVNEKYRGIPVNNVTKLDINSSYPNQMTSFWDVPYGEPVMEEKKGYNFRFYKITVLKSIENTHGLPFVPLMSESFTSYEYPRKLLEGEVVYLTSLDFVNFCKYYNVKRNDVKSEIHFYFQSMRIKNVFKDYVEQFFTMKNQAKLENNYVKLIFAKTMLNSLYGKFGSKIEKETAIYLPKTEDRWHTIIAKTKPKYYLPFAIVITSLARQQLVNAVGKEYDNFVYADTDSIAVRGFDTKYFPNVKLDKNKLGYWDVEVDKCLFLSRRAKQYLVIDRFDNEKVNIKHAGINFDRVPDIEISIIDYILGKHVPKQLTPSRRLEGIVLEEIEKEIKPIWDYKPLREQKFKDEKSYKKHLLNHWFGTDLIKVLQKGAPKKEKNIKKINNFLV